VFGDLEIRIGEAMTADRYRLRRRLKGLMRDAKEGERVERRVRKFWQEIEQSCARANRRRRSVPAIKYPEELPVCGRREEIAAAIDANQVVIVCGETGSGKSTQLPKICLGLGRGATGTIGHTQPRRIAARSVAARIAEELGSPLGQLVGFKIRFADSTGENTCVKLMTDGILLAETQGDRFLEQYDTIILDEAHERSLNIDFLIGYLKRLLPKRPDLKVIITSATIDARRFARHFPSGNDPAPIIEVGGRMFPVELRHCPLADDEDGEADWIAAVAGAVEELALIDDGDVLIFAPTERDIHELAKVLRGRRLPGDDGRRRTEILPLYARLPGAEQQRIFRPHKHRRIVIATNVAESSLTVPGIRYVIDPGTARISRYSARSKTQRLPIEPISQASADQRAGRCGRVGPGICVRLFSEDDYENRDRFTAPEIRRSNLASVILQAKALRLGKIERFPFLDPPKTATIRDGYKTLFELGAVDRREELTPLGRKLGRLPVDPRIARMILAAAEEDCLAEVLIIAAALEIRDPRDRPHEKRQAADEAHAKFAHEESDFFTYLKLWDFYHELKQKLSRNQLRKACRQNFLAYNRMREWTDVYKQLLRLIEETGLKRRRRRDEYGPVHRAILTGLLANVANRTATYEYTAAGGTSFHLWPGSATFDAKPDWVMAAELVETTRRYLRTSARIDPKWIEPIAEHLVNRSYSEPHWHGKGGSAMAYERVSLFGLIVVPRRRVALGPIDPATSREMLIRHGLVEGDLQTNAPFFRHNRELAEQMQRLEKKLRRSDMLRGPWAQYEFFDARLPEDVCDLARLNRWRKTAERQDPRELFLSESDLIDEEEPVELDPAAFPDAIDAGGVQLPIEYEYDPGSDDDGIHLNVPLEELNQVDPHRVEWLVPGLLEQKVTALIRSLPKPLRRTLVPAPDTARQVAAGLRFGEGQMLTTVAAALGRLAGETITPDDFRLDRLPGELRMNLRVLDVGGEPIAKGRDLSEVRRQVGDRLSESLAAVDDTAFNRDGLTAWDFDELPEQVELKHGVRTLAGFPALIDRRESVSLRLADTLERAIRHNRRGMARLFYFAATRDLRSQVAWFPSLDEMLLHAASILEFDLRQEITELLALLAPDTDAPLPRRREEFDAYVERARGRIGLAVQEAAGILPPLFAAYHQAQLAVEEATSPRWKYAANDVRQQLDRLMVPGFLTETPTSWLKHYPRYLRAIVARLEALRGGSLRRDRECCEEIAARWEAYHQRARQQREMGVDDEELVYYRWMLEEYRVSMFAQKLGTSIRVSSKRLDEQWAKTQG